MGRRLFNIFYCLTLKLLVMDKMSKLPLPINVLELELGELFIIKGGLTPDSSGLLSGIGCGCGCSNVVNL